MPKSYLSPGDRARIERELKVLRARRRATDRVGEEPAFYRPPEVDISDATLAAQEKKLQGVLERETPPDVSPSQKNAAYGEFKTLVKEWEQHALTKYDQGLGYPEIMKRTGPDHERDYERAKEKCMSWEMGPRGQAVGHRLKELAGVLDRDNPKLRNLENFRRRK